MGTKGVEMAIWNSLENSGDERCDQKVKKGYNIDLEKQGRVKDVKSSRWSKFFEYLLYVVYLLQFIKITIRFGLWDVKRFKHGNEVVDVLVNSQDNAIQHSFEVTVEKLPETEPVYTEHLISHSFGDSWGKPATVKFKPYKGGSYDKIVLELITNVTGRQFDRLVHVFLSDINVWRSSTVEPWGGKTIVSESIKDISQYRSLFDREYLEATLQLDNLVTSRLTGVFNVELLVHYYQSEAEVQTYGPSLREKLLQFFTMPADHITPLVTKFSRTPLFYYPRASQHNPRWSRSLPELQKSTNSSRAIIEIFASGNAAEEFWYTNVLDRYTNRFREFGHELLGHGPFRAIKVYLTNSETEILVDSIVPTPVIFTGFFPPLWRPCVGMNAFDLESFKVDLTPFIPLFEDETWQLELEVVSSIDSKFKTTVGENWIISGNLFVWNSTSDITALQFLNSTTLPSSFDVKVNDSRSDELAQDLTATEGVLIESTVSVNGTEYLLRQTTESRFTSNQLYLDNGDVEEAFVELFKIKKSTFQKDGIDLFEHLDKTGWRFSGDIKMLSVAQNTSELTYTANIARSQERLIALEDKKADKSQSGAKDVLFFLQGSQEGQANYTLSPKGNHGFGDSVHSVRVERAWPYEDNYKRTVIVKANEVVADRYE